MKKKTLRILTIAGVIATGLSVYAFVGHRESTADIENRETLKVTKNDIEETVMATGIIKPRVGAEVRIGSRASGTVESLYVNTGDRIEKGELIARLDDREYQSALSVARANVLFSREELKYASLELDRMEKLSEKEFTSKQSLDNANKAVALANARLLQDEARLKAAQIDLGYTRITAPISGVIASVSTQEGETVSATFNAPVFVTVIDLERLEVQAFVDETDIGRIEVGQQAMFTVDTYREVKFSGRVTAIYPQAEIRNNVVNYIVLISIDPFSDYILRPEMTASVTLYTSQRKDVITIPTQYINRVGGNYTVTLLENDGLVERIIEPGVQTRYKTEIISGLQEGDQLIINKQ